jgi:hypothetical protein
VLRAALCKRECKRRLSRSGWAKESDCAIAYANRASMKPGDRRVIDAVEEDARHEVGARTIEIAFRGGLEENPPAFGENLERARARVVVAKPSIAARQPDPASRGELDIGENFCVSGRR